MANGSIKISFSSIDSGIGKLGGITDSLSLCSSKLNTSWDKIDSRVKTKLGSNYDVSKIDDIQKRLEEINSFLGIVLITYQAADIDLSSNLDLDQLIAIYPSFANLSDERKAIVLSALRYLGLNGAQVMSYSSNFSSQFASKQFRGNAIEHAWCAMFVGSMISYFFGDQGDIINPAYASVWKIIGNYNNQTGIAFNTDDRVHYYVSQGCLNLYKSGNPDYQFSSWQKNLDAYNAKHGTNLNVSDWIDEDFVPEAGDIIVFSNNNRNGGKKYYYPNDTMANSHIGFVLGTRTVNGVLYIDTVEGNVRNDVEVRSFRADDPYLVGYGHIDYERFYSDQTAVQKTISQGIDINASKAKVGLLTSQLLAFNPSSKESKENYLVNLANNLGKSTGATVGASHIPAKSTDSGKQATTVVATSAPSQTITSTQQVSQTTGTVTTVSQLSSTTYSSQTYHVSSSSIPTQTVAPTVDQTVTPTVSPSPEPTPVTTIAPSPTIEASDKPSKPTWSDIYKDLDKYVDKYKPKTKSHVLKETIPEQTSSQELKPQVDYPSEETIPQVSDTLKPVSTSPVKEETPSTVTRIEPEDEIEYIPEQIDNVDEVVEEVPVEVTDDIPLLEPEDQSTDDVSEIDDRYNPNNEDFKPWDDYDKDESTNYPNQFEDEPTVIPEEKPNVETTTETTDETSDNDSSGSKNNNWVGIAVAGLGIATGGAAIAYTVNKKKKRSEEE